MDKITYDMTFLSKIQDALKVWEPFSRKEEKSKLERKREMKKKMSESEKEREIQVKHRNKDME